MAGAPRGEVRDRPDEHSCTPGPRHPRLAPPPRSGRADRPHRPFKIVSWNLLRRTGAAVDDVAALVDQEKPDLLLMQEATRAIGFLRDRDRRPLCLGAPAGPDPRTGHVEPEAVAGATPGDHAALRRPGAPGLPDPRPGGVRRRQRPPVARPDAEPPSAPPHRRRTAAAGGGARRLQHRRPRTDPGLSRCRAAAADPRDGRRPAPPARPMPGPRPRLPRARGAAAGAIRSPADRRPSRTVAEAHAPGRFKGMAAAVARLRRANGSAGSGRRDRPG